MKNMMFLSFSLLILLVSCTHEEEIEFGVKDMKKFDIRSAFENNDTIPERYTCKGDNINPPIEFQGLPEETKSIALIVDDPDAPVGTWDHWLIWNIKPGVDIKEDSVPEGSTQGENGWGKNEYGGPCPPSGTHRYFFKTYALDKELELPEGSDKSALHDQIETHAIGKAELIGLVSK